MVVKNENVQGLGAHIKVSVSWQKYLTSSTAIGVPFWFGLNLTFNLKLQLTSVFDMSIPTPPPTPVWQHISANSFDIDLKLSLFVLEMSPAGSGN